ncbi:MAG: hypothetical protein KHY12_02120, partial [Firmicutes bacterium]|nr:hypothetical protein [Bacillota bacterium]
YFLGIAIPPDVVLSFSYIRGLLSIVLFYWFSPNGREPFAVPEIPVILRSGRRQGHTDQDHLL